MSARAAQLISALDETLRRVRNLRCLGPQYAGRDGPGAYVGLWVEDAAGTGTTFLWRTGETVGEALDRVDAQWRQHGHADPRH